MGISHRIDGHIPSGYDIHSLPWKDPPFLRTVRHLSMGRLYHGELLVITRGCIFGISGEYDGNMNRIFNFASMD